MNNFYKQPGDPWYIPVYDIPFCKSTLDLLLDLETKKQKEFNRKLIESGLDSKNIPMQPKYPNLYDSYSDYLYKLKLWQDTINNRDENINKLVQKIFPNIKVKENFYKNIKIIDTITVETKISYIVDAKFNNTTHSYSMNNYWNAEKGAYENINVTIPNFTEALTTGENAIENNVKFPEGFIKLNSQNCDTDACFRLIKKYSGRLLIKGSYNYKYNINYSDNLKPKYSRYEDTYIVSEEEAGSTNFIETIEDKKMFYKNAVIELVKKHIPKWHIDTTYQTIIPQVEHRKNIYANSIVSAINLETQECYTYNKKVLIGQIYGLSTFSHTTEYKRLHKASVIICCSDKPCAGLDTPSINPV